MTEKRLYQAFDLQRFVGNARLQNVIDAAHRRSASCELADEDLELVSAAGQQELLQKPGEKDR